jgi:hypothetical protein
LVCDVGITYGDVSRFGALQAPLSVAHRRQ